MPRRTPPPPGEGGPLSGDTNKLRQYRDFGISQDLEDEEVVLGILERGSAEEVERFRAFHRLTKEQVEIMQYYVQLRRATLDQMQHDITRRVDNNPHATEEEMAIGAYLEQIETQVRSAVQVLRRKGYSTINSGFSGLHSQKILFSEPRKVELPPDLILELKNKDITVKIGPEEVDLHARVLHPREQRDVKFECNRPLTLDELKEAWDKIAEALPDFGVPAPPSRTGAAESFRKRQERFSKE